MNSHPKDVGQAEAEVVVVVFKRGADTCFLSYRNDKGVRVARTTKAIGRAFRYDNEAKAKQAIESKEVQDLIAVINQGDGTAITEATPRRVQLNFTLLPAQH